MSDVDITDSFYKYFTEKINLTLNGYKNTLSFKNNNPNSVVYNEITNHFGNALIFMYRVKFNIIIGKFESSYL